jgi:YrbI family 3-deoxy-D-manno-octulosonate 8-phosphate phosphatase
MIFAFLDFTTNFFSNHTNEHLSNLIIQKLSNEKNINKTFFFLNTDTSYLINIISKRFKNNLYVVKILDEAIEIELEYKKIILNECNEGDIIAKIGLNIFSLENHSLDDIINYFLLNKYDLLSTVTKKNKLNNESKFEIQNTSYYFENNMLELIKFKFKDDVHDKTPLQRGIFITQQDDSFGFNQISESKLFSPYLKFILKAKKIKLFISDVDGTLTDAGMYYSESGDELKRFSTYDGKGFELLRKAGIKTGIITSENTKLVENRAKKLKLDFLYQGVENAGKLNTTIAICHELNISLHEVAYIGDDINCKELLENVGLPACPNNSMHEIKNIKNILHLTNNGGNGAVREFAEFVLKINKSII